jgi:hypothetical protein
MLNLSLQFTESAGNPEEPAIGTADPAVSGETETQASPAALTGEGNISPVCAARWAY